MFCLLFEEKRELKFKLDQTSLDGIYFDSREAGANVSPQLVVSYVSN
jgi:hypothetical protein